MTGVITREHGVKIHLCWKRTSFNTKCYSWPFIKYTSLAAWKSVDIFLFQTYINHSVASVAVFTNGTWLMPYRRAPWEPGGSDRLDRISPRSWPPLHHYLPPPIIPGSATTPLLLYPLQGGRSNTNIVLLAWHWGLLLSLRLQIQHSGTEPDAQGLAESFASVKYFTATLTCRLSSPDYVSSCDTSHQRLT